MASSNVPNSKSPVCDRTLATVHDCIHNIDRYKAFISNIMVIDLYSYDAVFCTMVFNKGCENKEIDIATSYN